MQWRLIAQGQQAGETLARAITETVKDCGFDRLDVAVAYATRNGLKALLGAIQSNPIESRWVVGLDDAITQPAALEDLMKMEGAQVRLAALSPKRFHPKLYCLWSAADATRCTSIIGSGNMTMNGLNNNGETAVILSADKPEHANQLRAQWEAMWELGEDANPKRIEDYKKVYLSQRSQKKKIVQQTSKKITALQITPKKTKLNLSVAHQGKSFADAEIVWTEAGSPSAGGRDLEFPSKIMPFFALKVTPVTQLVRINSKIFPLTFTERKDNDMWRLLFSKESVKSAVGRENLRPIEGKNRSDLAIIFTKIKGEANFDVQMVVIGSPEHKELMQRSQKVNGLLNTGGAGGRYFGFL